MVCPADSARGLPKNSQTNGRSSEKKMERTGVADTKPPKKPFMRFEPNSTTKPNSRRIMTVIIGGKTPMERLTHLTKRVIAVPNDEVEREEQKRRTTQATET
jgi:hypothetical protein